MFYCYSCSASNIAGADVNYTYLYVFSPEVDSAAEMSGLVYPMIPLPVTTTITTTTTTAITTATTSVAHNSTAVATTFGPEPEINTSTSAPPPPTSTLRRPEVTSSSSGSRDPDRMMSRETGDNAVAVVIAACVAGAFLLVFLVVSLVGLMVRRRRHSGKYDPSRPHGADDRCCRLCAPCCPAPPGHGSPDDPDFDASTVRLKLNTSAFSVASTSTADRSFERPSGNGVTTRPDPVQQTLIGPPPPLTKDALSR